jgi:hypothetical protein
MAAMSSEHISPRGKNMTNRREGEEIMITLKIVQELQGLNPCITPEPQSAEALK